MKKIKTLRTVIFFSFFSFTVLAIILVNGCNKMNVTENGSSNEKTALVSSAQNHFKNLAENETANSARSSVAVKVKSTKNRVTPLSKMSPYIDWENATEIKGDKLSYTIVPVKDDTKRFKDKEYEFFRSIIFYRNESAKNNIVILEVLSMKGKLLGDDFHKIVSTAFENKYFSRSQDIIGLNAFVLFFKEDYTEDKSFQLTDGKWAPARVSFRSDLEINQ
jgi:hypothetical protein